MTKTTPPAETAKSLAAKLREIVDAATGYTPEQLKKNNRYSLWGQVGEVAVDLESFSESLTGLKEAVEAIEPGRGFIRRIDVLKLIEAREQASK